MNAKNLVLKYLKSHGIVATKNEVGLNFIYEGWNFLFWNDADDPLFFRLTLPGIFDVTDTRTASIRGPRYGCVTSRSWMPLRI